MHLSHEQQDAIDMCLDLTEKIVAVTGGAGTGKTTILKDVHDQLSHVRTVLCAPTGRAAKRIQEATGIRAMTVHRLLEFPRPNEDDDKDDLSKITINDGFEGGFSTSLPRRNKNRPLEQRVVLIDEASMVGRTLYNQILDALRHDAVVRFFGDNNQLPPVEDGIAPFRKMIMEMPTTWLTHNYRSEDAIIGNALRILRGSIPLSNSQFEVYYHDDPLLAMLQMVDKTFIKHDAQIITPTRRGVAGTIKANTFLQMKFNRNGDYIRLDRLNKKEKPILIRANDKFLWVKNDYNFEMFNGEFGTIDAIDDETGELILGMPDRSPLHIPPSAVGRGPFGNYLYDPRKQIELGYAATTHKAQGSEFNDVVYYMSSEQPFLLNRNNFYTAVTRARRFVVVVCNRRAMKYSITRKE